MPVVVALALLLATLAVGQWPLLRDIHEAWSDKYGAYSHGYLVLVLAIVFAMRQLRRPPPLEPGRPSWIALPVFALLLAASIALDRLFVGGIRSLLLPPLLLCAVAIAAGLPMARRLLGPAALLWLGLPLWSPVNGALQSLTTHVAGRVLEAIGIPVYLEGSFVHLPSGSFEIAAGCSGLNYFLAALVMGAFACAFLVTGLRQRLTIMVVAAALGIVANWIRVVSLVIIGHRTEMQSYLIRVDHLWFGWVIFLAAMVPVILLARRYPAQQATVAVPSQAMTSEGFAGTVVACALLLVPVLVPGWSASRLATAPDFETVVFPSGWSPGFAGASIHRDVVDAQAGPTVEVVRARYERQQPEGRISAFVNSTTGKGWSAANSRRLGPPMRVVTEHEGAVGGRQGLVWDWFVVGGQPVASAKVAYRLRELVSLFSGRRDAEIIALHSNCDGNCETARAAMAATASQLLNSGDVSTGSHFVQP